MFDPSLPREPNGDAGQYGRPLPPWLAEHFADAVECALDPGCEAEQCEQGVEGHPRVREVNVVLGDDLWYLCARHLQEALSVGRIRPQTCLRCGQGEGVNMGHLRAVSPPGVAFTLWYGVCDRCRRRIEDELEVPA